MVLPFVGRLAGQALRDLARNLFPGFYERGISANQALSELKGQGLGYRRQDFLADFRQGLEGYDQATTIGRLGDSFTPRESILKPQYLGTPDRYSFVLRASVVDPVSKDESVDYFTYHRNSLDTKGSMQDDAMEWYNGQSDTDATFAYKVKIIEGYINPVWT